jgi:hypothetical protein
MIIKEVQGTFGFESFPETFDRSAILRIAFAVYADLIDFVLDQSLIVN